MSSLKKGIQKFLGKVSTYEINDKNIRKAIREFELLLISNDVSLKVAKQISKKLTSKMLGKRAKRFSDLSKMIPVFAKPIILGIISPKKPLDLIEILENHRKISSQAVKKSPLVFLFLGINGTGKTTSIAKLSYLFKIRGYKVVLAASDTFRSGAQEQLKVHADRIGVKIIRGKYGSDSAAVAYDAIAHAKAKYADAVMIDTSGRMAVNQDLMEEMKKIHRVTKPDFAILVVDALAGNDATEQAIDFHKEIPLNGIILAKMDADARGGALISVTFATGGVPVLFLGTGQKYTDFESFQPKKYVDQLLK
ncbi:MAG: signal recognition particle-docking protein FtsY [Candidatus Heimdallarchaeota archaeon]|nr:MAG: signal recognition particle-docking protein FtsY [Candidatus Heimdallarchaeota archaeon]